MPPLTEAQRKLRRKSIGSSDASWIMNRKKWPELYKQKALGERDPIPMRRQLQMDCGHALEPVVMKWLEWKKEKIVQRDVLAHFSATCDDGTVPLASRVDCFIARESPDNSNADLGVEIKSTFWRVTPPVMVQQYYPQVQHHMIVWDAAEWELVYITMNGVDFYRTTVPRDEDWIRNYLKRCCEFWNFHVINQIPPEEKKR